MPSRAILAAAGMGVSWLAGPALATTGVPHVVADPAAPAILVRPPGTPLYNWLAGSLPTLLIVAGSLVVVIVLLSRAKAARAPKPLSLEERFARLAAEQEGRPETHDRGGPEPRAASRQTPSRASGPAPGPSRPPTADDALDAVIRDTEELAQRLAAAMDARAARLETLIREADDRLRRLESARTPHAPAPSDGSFIEPRRSDATRPALALAAARAAVPSFDADAADPVHRQVFDLADQGLPALDIARRLGQPTGQVELILALRGR